MSNKELAIQLINQIPDYKIGYAIAYLQGLNADEIADDDFCMQMLNDYENSTDKGEFIPFDEAVRMCGVDINAIQN
ncbi:MAG: hypothetical protein PUB37_07055 [Firmicutes bacterium]|nr:hypothetical protein [Bacillota bacterium]